MTTANDVIKAALRIAGVTSIGSAPTAEETQDALSCLNDLLDSMSNDGLFIYANTEETFPLTAGKISYTIGAGGDFNTVRPTTIAAAFVRIGQIDYDVSIITDEEYAQIPLKQITSIPYFMNYEAGYPLGTLKLYPAPNAGTLHLLSEKPLQTLTLNQTLSLPPGWNRYLKNQLALEICSEYGVNPPPMAIEVALDAGAKIKRATSRVKSMDAQPLGRGGNIYDGWLYR